MAMGTVSYEHQGRKIESARMNNLTDAYVVNGWESELTENYSGNCRLFSLSQIESGYHSSL